MSDLLAQKRRLLAEQLELGQRAADALEHSWSKVRLECIGEADPDLEETLEALTARFARLEDILIKRVFRAVVAVELADAERLLDVLDLMARLRLIESTEQWIELLIGLVIAIAVLQGLLGLHELVDYNLFMPANQVVFALLLSVFLYPPQRLADTVRGPQRRARDVPDLAAEPRPGPVSTAPPADQIENPFLSAAER